MPRTRLIWANTVIWNTLSGSETATCEYLSKTVADCDAYTILLYALEEHKPVADFTIELKREPVYEDKTSLDGRSSLAEPRN